MKNHRLIGLVTEYIGPAAAILGGLILLFSPDTAIALVAVIVGWAAVFVGVLLAVAALLVREKLGNFIKAGVSIAAGLWLTRNPLSIAMIFGKLLGLALLIGAFSGFRRSNYRAGRTIYFAEGLLGLVLLVSPLTASRTVCTVLGLILVAVGIIMLLGKRNGNGRIDDGVIDV